MENSSKQQVGSEDRHAGLTLGVEIADAAAAILQRVEFFEQENGHFPKGWDVRAHARIDPMLLSFAMELAMKAWFVFDYNAAEAKRGHNLSELFEALLPESKERLDSEFRRSVAPASMDFFGQEYGIRDLLSSHANSFVDWRYLHETIKLPEKRPVGFHQSAIIATLEMVLVEFRKRYRTIEVLRPWQSES
ncbi:MAG: hypothetical protein ACKVLA_11285 [Rhodobacterales bacterium]